MRQRNIKDLDNRIEQNSTYLVREPRAMKGRWHEVFGNDRPIYLEIGSGKGRYIMTRAEADPEGNFIACEGREAVGLRILEKTEEAKLPNVRAVLCYMDDCREFFEAGELDGIYLNFSDPWPKGRHAKRRLTYGRNLEAMMDVLKPGAAIEFKTDNDPLFEFSVEEIAAQGYEILEMTRDLHGQGSEFESKKYITEYEAKFLSSGKNINYVKFRRKAE
ncbi:MAG: tRNA (guanosine(46)-N7)-methyltransferase TrmB [Clostridia bacterium]|nr:tRNA (guanosine(46)-N7)-methyltransferase TrmB [Clostridia bacterium]